MKFLTLTRLSSVAGLLLQCGSFVQASPLFQPTHSNSVEGDPCAGFRITYPTATDLVYDDNSKHIVAWQSPDAFQQVNITLVETETKVLVGSIGIYDANHGASDEIALDLGDHATGKYNYKIVANVETTTCELESSSFTINKRAVTTTTTTTSTTAPIVNTPAATTEDTASEDATSEEHEDGVQEDQWVEMDGEFDGFDDKAAQKDDTSSDNHDNSSYFTNSDLRTSHGNAAEWTEETAAHTNAAEWTEETDHSNEAHWDSEEIDVETEAHQNSASWIVDAASVPDHSNESQWSEEVVDANAPSSAIHSNVAEWTEETDHSNEAHWDSEEIDVETEAHQNSASWIVDAASVPDHSNESQWSEEVVDAATSHTNIAGFPNGAPGWVVEPVAHTNAAEWTEDNAAHTNAAGFPNGAPGWVVEPVAHTNAAEWTEDNAAHTNAAGFPNGAPGWVVEPVAHTNAAEWTEDNAAHTNAAGFPNGAPGWVVEPVAHTNAAEWTEDNAAHTNAAGFPNGAPGWVVEPVAHTNAAEWTEETAAHTNAAEWTEDNAAHTNAADFVTGWTDKTNHNNEPLGMVVNELSDASHTNANWVEEAHTNAVPQTGSLASGFLGSKTASADSHNNNVDITSAEQLMSHW
ncbi:hypothetical protein BDF14DRAFT_1960508 [Spinellus fusiger]|nr:hypothetical protein BDF14DRAFT_1960508 [Spinellus fusiger]